MNEKLVAELVEIASEIGVPQAKVANLMGYTENYWFKLRSGRAPMTAEVREEVKTLIKKFKAFKAA